MIRYCLLLMVISLNVLAYGQSGEIYLSVAMPQNCILDGNSKTILKNKLKNS